MIHYIIMLIIILFCVFKEDRAKSLKDKKHYLLCSLTPVFCLIAFKSNMVGTDTFGYMRSYETLAHFGTFDSLDEFGYENVEIGYKYFILFLSKIFPNAQFLLIAVGLAVCISMYSFIRRTATNWSFALFLFVALGYFQFVMTGIRQTLAMSILLFGYKYINERKIIKILVGIVFASLFHKSALIFIPIYFIANMEITRKKIGFMFVGIFALLFVADKLLLSVADVMDYKYGIEETGNGYIFFAIVLFITILSLSRRRQLMATRDTNSSMLSVNFVSLALWGVRLISRTVERVSLYFMPYTYIALEEYIATSPKNVRKQYMILAIILFSILFIKRISEQEDLCNFTFFFE